MTKVKQAQSWANLTFKMGMFMLRFMMGKGANGEELQLKTGEKLQLKT